jgi:hypothetical protein
VDGRTKPDYQRHFHLSIVPAIATPNDRDILWLQSHATAVRQ